MEGTHNFLANGIIAHNTSLGPEPPTEPNPTGQPREGRGHLDWVRGTEDQLVALLREHTGRPEGELRTALANVATANSASYPLWLEPLQAPLQPGVDVAQLPLLVAERMVDNPLKVLLQDLLRVSRPAPPVTTLPVESISLPPTAKPTAAPVVVEQAQLVVEESRPSPASAMVLPVFQNTEEQRQEDVRTAIQALSDDAALFIIPPRPSAPLADIDRQFRAQRAVSRAG